MDFSVFTQPLGQGANGINLFLAGLYCLFVGGLFAAVFPEKWKSTCLIMGSALSLPMVSYPAFSSLHSCHIYLGSMNLGPILGNVSLRIDPLGSFFIFLVV